MGEDYPAWLRAEVQDRFHLSRACHVERTAQLDEGFYYLGMRVRLYGVIGVTSGSIFLNNSYCLSSTSRRTSIKASCGVLHKSLSDFQYRLSCRVCSCSL
jgi:hypothetical protein